MYKQTRNVMDLERWSRDSGKATTYTRAVSVDKCNGNIYITEVGHSPQISVYSCDGELITRFNHELMGSPWGLVVDGLDIYVTDIALHTLLHFREDGPFVQVKLQSDFNNPFKEPRQIALSERGELYIADYGNHRVQVWDKNLKFIRNIEHTSLSYPIDVKVTTREIYVLKFHSYQLHSRVLSIRRDSTFHYLEWLRNASVKAIFLLHKPFETNHHQRCLELRN